MLCVCHTCKDLGINDLQLFGPLAYNTKGLLGLAFADTALESTERFGFFFLFFSFSFRGSHSVESEDCKVYKRLRITLATANSLFHRDSRALVNNTSGFFFLFLRALEYFHFLDLNNVFYNPSTIILSRFITKRCCKGDPMADVVEW